VASRYQEVRLPIPFGGGVDTQSDEKAVSPVQLLDLQNGVFDRATSIVKRNGYEALGRDVDGTPGIGYEAPDALAARDDELVLFANGRAYSHRTEIDTWSDSGPAACAVATEIPLVRTGTVQSQPDEAANQGATLVAWEDSRGGVWWSLLEEATGRILRPATQIDASGQRPRCVAVGTMLHLLWARPTGDLMIAVVSPFDTSWVVSPSILSGDLSIGNPSFDAIPTDQFADSGLVTWATVDGYRLGYLDVSGVLGSPATGHPSVVAVTGIVVDVGPVLDANEDNIVTLAHTASTLSTDIAWWDTTTLADSSGSAVAETATVARLAVCLSDAGFATAWREYTAASNRDHRVLVIGGVEGVFAEIASQRGAGIASRAFLDDNVAHCWLVHDVTFFAVYLCLRVTSAGETLIVSRTMPGIATGLPTRSHCPSVRSSGRVHSSALTYHEQIDTPTGVQRGESAIRRVVLDFDHPASFQSAQIGRGLYLAAAAPLHYDGDRWSEWGWHYGPDDVADPLVGSGGAMTPLATYLYVYTYEEIDAQGEIHQGPTSAGSIVTMGASDTSTAHVVPTYRATSKRRARIGVWRSAPDDSTVLRRVSSVDPTAIGANGYVLNDPTVDTVAFVDEMSDLEWAAQEPLYTNGGVISNEPTSVGGGALAVGKGRLFWTDPADPNLVRYSQQLREGYAVEMAAPLFQRVDPYGGDIVGISVLDDVVIVFKETAIFAFGGPGPLADPTVETNAFSFTPSQLVTSDVGLESVGTIGYTPVGLVFQTGKGIYLLDRSRQVSKVGAPVDAYAAQPLTRAVLLPDRSQIVFLSSEGRTLLWDYEHNQWSTFTNHTGWDAIVVNRAFYYLRTDERVFKETIGVYADDNLQIKLLLDTAWIKLAGYLQGWQQVHEAHFLGRFVSDHTLRVHVQLDYEDGWGEPFDLDVTADYNAIGYGEGNYGAGPYGLDVATSTVYQRVIHIGEQCESIRFRLEDIEPTVARGASFELTELLLTGAILAASFRLPESRRS